MRNLKKMLSLVMALAMVASFMVVGASAQFSDDKDIVNKDAVETLVSLGVIKGRDTGAFDPAGIVTRAEMAKMICVAMAGGKDPTMVGSGIYPDTKGHWAAGYIDYCANMGYVAGNTDGNFYPDKTVTGTEAAKMILTILGYDATVEKFVNDANWETNINSIANTRGIYDNVSVIPNQGLTRDNAAQMIYNGLDTNMVKYELVGIVGGNGVSRAVEITNPTKTILTDKFKMQTGYSYLTNVSYDDVKKEYAYDLRATADFGANITDDGYTATVKSAKDYSDLYGMKVRTLYKVDNNKTTVYGVYAVDSSVIATGFAGDVKQPDADATSVKIAGTSYKLSNRADQTKIFNNNSATATGSFLRSMTETDMNYAIKLIDNNGDAKADVVIKTPFTVAKVTYVGKDSLTLDHALGNKKLDDVAVYEGVKKDDIVVYTAAALTIDDTATIVKADVKNGKIDSTKTSSGVVNYEIDGTWFKKVNTADEGALNDTIDYVAFGNYLYYTKTTSGQKTLADIAVVLGVKNTPANTMTGEKDEANLLFADGTKKVVTTVDANGDPAAATPGQMVTYETNNDGEYVLTAVSGSNKAGYEDYATTAASGSPTITEIGGHKVADDAVVFIYFGSSDMDGKIYTGKEFKTLTPAAYTVPQVLTDKVNGFEYAQVIKVEGVKPASITSGDIYGYLTSDTSTTKDGGKTYRNFVLWTAKGEMKVKQESNASQLSAGTVVAFNDAGNGMIKNVSVINTTAAAVTGWNGKDIALLTGVTTTNSKVTDDTTIIYVDSDAQSGAEGEGIPFAGKPDGTNYAENVRYIVSGDHVAVILVDVNNDYKVNYVAVKSADAANAVIDGSTLKVDVAGPVTVATVKGYLETSAVQSVEIYRGTIDDAGKQLDGTNVAVGDILVVTFANGDTTEFTIAQKV